MLVKAAIRWTSGDTGTGLSLRGLKPPAAGGGLLVQHEPEPLELPDPDPCVATHWCWELPCTARRLLQSRRATLTFHS